MSRAIRKRYSRSWARMGPMSKLQKTVKKHIKCSLAPSGGVFQVFYCHHQIRRTYLPLVRMFRFRSQKIHFGRKSSRFGPYLYYDHNGRFFFRPTQTCFLLAAKLGEDIVKRFSASCTEFQGAVPRRALFSNFDWGTGEKPVYRRYPKIIGFWTSSG